MQYAWLTQGSKRFYLLWVILCVGNALFQSFCASSAWLQARLYYLYNEVAKATQSEMVYQDSQSTLGLPIASILLSCYLTLVLLRETRGAARMHICIFLLLSLVVAGIAGLIWGSVPPLIAPTAGLFFLYLLHIFLPSSTVE